MERYDSEFHCGRRGWIERLESRKCIAQRIAHWFEEEGRCEVLRSIEISTCKLTHTRNDSFIPPSLFDPPGIEAACIHAGHPTWTGEQTQIGPEIAAALPKRCCVKIQPLLTDQRAKIDVDRSAKSVPNGQSLFLFAFDIPEGIADVLKIEAHSMLLKACSLTVPLPEDVTMGALTGFVAVRTRKRLLLPGLFHFLLR